MVDDQDEKPVNALEGTSAETESPTLTRLREIAEQNSPGAAEAEDRRRAQFARQTFPGILTLSEESRMFKSVTDLLKKSLTTKDRLEPRIRVKEESRQKALSTRAVNEVARETSEEAINSDIAHRATSEEAQFAALS